MNRKLFSITLIAAIALCLIFGGIIIRGNSGSETPALAQNGETEDESETYNWGVANQAETKRDYKGTYETPIHYAGTGDYSTVCVNDQNRLGIPECDITAVRSYRYDSTVRLLDPNEEAFFEILRSMQDFDAEEHEVMLFEDEVLDFGRAPTDGQDASVGFELTLTDGTKLGVTAVSFSDDYVEVHAVRTDCDRTTAPDGTVDKEVWYSGTSAELHSKLRELLGVKNGSREVLQGAESVLYYTEDCTWEQLSAEKIARLAELVGNAETATENLGGDIFIAVEINKGGEWYEMCISGQSGKCIYIEDKVYTLNALDALELLSIFDKRWNVETSTGPMVTWWPEFEPTK